jgi:6-phosphogluconate dehydrogenase
VGGSDLLALSSSLLESSEMGSGRALIEAMQERALVPEPDPRLEKIAGDLKIPVPLFSAALAAWKKGGSSGPKEGPGRDDREESGLPALLNDAQSSLFAMRSATLIQGIRLLNAAAIAYDYLFNLENLIRLWQEGTWFRSEILKEAKSAFREGRSRSVVLGILKMMMFLQFHSTDPLHLEALKRFAQKGGAAGIPCPLLDASLAYWTEVRARMKK